MSWNFKISLGKLLEFHIDFGAETLNCKVQVKGELWIEEKETSSFMEMQKYITDKISDILQRCASVTSNEFKELHGQSSISEQVEVDRDAKSLKTAEEISTLVSKELLRMTEKVNEMNSNFTLQSKKIRKLHQKLKDLQKMHTRLEDTLDMHLNSCAKETKSKFNGTQEKLNEHFFEFQEEFMTELEAASRFMSNLQDQCHNVSKELKKKQEIDKEQEMNVSNQIQHLFEKQDDLSNKYENFLKKHEYLEFRCQQTGRTNEPNNEDCSHNIKVIQEFLVGQVIFGNIMSSEALNEQKLSTVATCLSSEVSADPNESEGNNDKSNGNLNCNHPSKYSSQEEKGSLNLGENSWGETIPDTPESDNLNVALGESKNTFSCEHSKEDLIQSLNDNDNSNIQDVDDIDNSYSAVKNIAEGLQINTFQSDSSVFPLDQNCEDVDMEDVEKKELLSGESDEPLSSKTNQRCEQSVNKKDSLKNQQHKIISQTIDDVTSSEDIQDTNLLSKLNQPDVPKEVEDVEMLDISVENVGIYNTCNNFESTTTQSSEDLNKDIIENSESSNKQDHTLQNQNINKTSEIKIDNDNFIESQPDQPSIQSLEEKDFPDSTALTEGVTKDNTKTESEDSREDQSNLPNSQHPESRQPLDFTPNSDCSENDQIKAEVSQTSQQFSLPSEEKVSPDSSQGSKLFELEAEKSDSKDSREDQTDLQFSQSSQRDTPDSTEKETGEKAEGAINDSQTLEESICPDSTQDLENTDKKESEEMGACASKNQDNASDDGPRKKSASKRKENRNKKYRYGDKDTERYRAGYPGLKGNINWKDNYKFYMGKIESQPNGDYIDKIHKYWEKDYNRLEQHHGYIQWIFPIREESMNSLAQPLQLHEAEAIQKNPVAKARVLKSYKMMLGFYGMKLVDEERGTIQRAKNYRECFENLTYHTHNYLRITRILKSLGELGYEHLKKPFLEFVLHEALVEKTLAPTLSSCENYWIGTIKNNADREELYTLIDESRQAKKGRGADSI
ncbi:uncharacterized protein LOC129921605 isoform X3 [Biomphalaria glabrata]|uniref:Uncharacterized protein LOC129921605 isoform X3 n=1 Tax=Biomphalaria glabrata TaxID=6526 RepID=A0A9W3BLE2_BIOGL|nr:uncharacterized protein LOC129921605 isoform X3 [Biomphalaria glabrata]